MEFKTYIRQIAVFDPPGIKGTENFDVSGLLTANWSFEIDAREEGIKNLSMQVSSIKGLITISKWTEGDDIETEIEFDSDHFEIKNNIEIQAGQVWPGDVEISFTNKTIKIS